MPEAHPPVLSFGYEVYLVKKMFRHFPEWHYIRVYNKETTNVIPRVYWINVAEGTPSKPSTIFSYKNEFTYRTFSDTRSPAILDFMAKHEKTITPKNVYPWKTYKDSWFNASSSHPLKSNHVMRTTIEKENVFRGASAFGNYKIDNFFNRELRARSTIGDPQLREKWNDMITDMGDHYK